MLTLRTHPVEIISAVVLLAIVGIAAFDFADRLTATFPEGCPREGAPGCRGPYRAFYQARDDSAWLRGAVVGVAPVLAGLLLGASIIAREFESRTAAMAWSLSASRTRWLLHRSLPPLVILILGLATVAILQSWLHEASFPRQRTGSIDWLGAQGLTFMTRGLGAFGLALFAGAAVGRTLPAFVISGIVGLLLIVPGAGDLRVAQARDLAVWRELPAASDEDFGPSLGVPGLWRVEWFRDDDGNAYRADSFFRSEVYRAKRRELGGGDEAYRWLQANFVRTSQVVPLSAYGAFERLEAGIGLVIASGSILATFVVVTRRRPG